MEVWSMQHLSEVMDSISFITLESHSFQSERDEKLLLWSQLYWVKHKKKIIKTFLSIYDQHFKASLSMIFFFWKEVILLLIKSQKNYISIKFCCFELLGGGGGGGVSQIPQKYDSA